MIARNDRPYGDVEKKALRYVPGLQRLYRAGVYATKEVTVPSFTLWPAISKPAQTQAIKNLKKGIKDPELREKVMPRFTFGCKRVLISNDYYPALAADNVDVVTDPIAKVTGWGPPAETLADTAEKENFDLVAVGHRGRGAVERLLLGSVADRLAQISHKPVLICRG